MFIQYMTIYDNTLHCKALHCRYILFSVRFRTDSSSVRKKILKYLRTFSEPIPVRFGIFGMDLLITFLNRFQFGSEKWYLNLSKKIPNWFQFSLEQICEQKALFDPILTIFDNISQFLTYIFISFKHFSMNTKLIISIIWKSIILFENILYDYISSLLLMYIW